MEKPDRHDEAMAIAAQAATAPLASAVLTVAVVREQLNADRYAVYKDYQIERCIEARAHDLAAVLRMLRQNCQHEGERAA